MKVITRNAEKHLFEQAELFSNKSRDGWQCIHFQIPEKWRQQHPTETAALDIHVIADLLVRSKGTIYQCSNCDVFILFSGRLSPVQVKLARYFWALETGHIKPSPDYSLFSIIDLGSDWNVFYKLCEDHYLKALASSETIRHSLPQQPETHTTLILVASSAGA